MRFLFSVAAIVLLHIACTAQKPVSGVYTYQYCDLEYNSCVGTCKVVIKGDSIIIYATKDLAKNRTFTEDGDIMDSGIILKHESGKWIVGKNEKDKNAKRIGAEGPAIIDFKKKQYWTF